MIEEAGEVKEENAADPIGRDTVLSFKTKKSGGIGSGEEFSGTKLTWTQKVVAEVEGTESGGNDLLK